MDLQYEQGREGMFLACFRHCVKVDIYFRLEIVSFKIICHLIWPKTL
jgi:hypothetical protein